MPFKIPMVAVDSDRNSGRVRLRNHALWRRPCKPQLTTPKHRPLSRHDLGAIFISLELSRSTWLITSLSPGGGEKMSKHSVRGGNVAGLLERFAQLQEKARARTGRTFPIIVIQEAGLDGFWQFIVCCRMKGSRATWSIQPRLQHHVDAGARRLTGSTVRRCFAHYWRISAANLGCARWSKRRPPKKRTAAVSAASAKY